MKEITQAFAAVVLLWSCGPASTTALLQDSTITTKQVLVAENEGKQAHIIADYTDDVPADTLWITTRYIGHDFPGRPLSLVHSGVENRDGDIRMVINTQDLSQRGLYREIRGGGPHLWLSKVFSEGVFPWSGERDWLAMRVYAAVPEVTLQDKDGRTGHMGFAPSRAPVTQLSFGFYLQDTISGNTFAYIVPMYESRGMYPESANNSDTYVSFVSTPIASRSQYVTKTAQSAVLQEVPYAEKKFFEIHVKSHNLLKAIEDTTNERLSKRLSAYRLTLVGILFELPNYVEGGHNTSEVNLVDFSVSVVGDATSGQ